MTKEELIASYPGKVDYDSLIPAFPTTQFLLVVMWVPLLAFIIFKFLLRRNYLQSTIFGVLCAAPALLLAMLGWTLIVTSSAQDTLNISMSELEWRLESFEFKYLPTLEKTKYPIEDISLSGDYYSLTVDAPYGVDILKTRDVQYSANGEKYIEASYVEGLKEYGISDSLRNVTLYLPKTEKE
jgi:hypothetical protein